MVCTQNGEWLYVHTVNTYSTYVYYQQNSMAAKNPDDQHTCNICFQCAYTGLSCHCALVTFHPCFLVYSILVEIGNFVIIHTYNIHTYIHTYTHIHTYIHTHTHTYIPMYTHTDICTYICTYIHTYIQL